MSELRMSPTWRVDLARDSYDERLRAMKTAEDAAKRVCPIRLGNLVRSIEGEADKETMNCRLSAGDAEEVDYAAVVELGGRPHIIAPRKPGGILTNARTMLPHEAYFFSAGPVQHPGTPAQPYLRPGVAAIGGHR